MNTRQAHILLVDDEQGILVTLLEVLREAGYRVSAAQSGEEALSVMEADPIDLLLADLRIDSYDGMSLLAEARQRDPEMLAILLTGYASVDSAIQALRNGAFAYLLKPCNIEELKLTIDRGLEKKRLAEALRRRVKELEEAYAWIRSSSAELEDRVRAATSELAARVRELQESRARLRAIIDSMSQGLIVYDGAGQTVLANAYLRSLFGLSSAELMGKPAAAVQRVMHEPPLDAGQTSLDPVTNRLVNSIDFEIDRPPYRVVRRVISAIPGEGDVQLGQIVLYQDLTEQKELDRLKDDFVSMASHELKTPLTSILGAAQLLLRNNKGELAAGRGSQMLEIIDTQSRRMERLVNDLLDVSHIERKTLNISRNRVDLTPLVSGAVNALRPVSSKHTFGTSLPPHPVMILADEERIRQVLDNLLSNALKCSPDGGAITVILRQTESSAEVEVRDPGVGIPQEQIPHVFDRFYQAHNVDRSRRFGGLGLGLFISKAIIDDLGGSIGVESTSGKGSSFHFALPLAP